MFLRVVAPHFVAAIEYDGKDLDALPVHSAPILRWVVKWGMTLREFRAIAKRKHWKLQMLHD